MDKITFFFFPLASFLVTTFLLTYKSLQYMIISDRKNFENRIKEHRESLKLELKINENKN